MRLRGARQPTTAQPLLDPLSKRELEVLQLIFCCHALSRAAVGTSEQFSVYDPMLVAEYDMVHNEG